MRTIKDFIKGLFGSLCPTCKRWYFDRHNKEAINYGIECLNCDHVRGEIQDAMFEDAMDIAREMEEVLLDD